MEIMPLAQIVVADRYRKNLGDLGGLATSIAEIGLLHPIVIDLNGDRLLAGARRLAAVQQLGWTEIAVTPVADLNGYNSAMRIQADENTCRKDLDLDERLELGEALRPLEEKAANEREREGGKTAGRGRPKGSGKLPYPIDGGRVDERIAAAVGMKRKSYEKAKHVKQVAEQFQEAGAPIFERMVKSGKVDSAYQAARRLEAAEERKVAPAVHDDRIFVGRFQDLLEELEPESVDLILTDPPYDEESVGLFADLSAFASVALRPGGLCMAISGHSFLGEAIGGLSSALDYMWCCAIRHTGGELRIRKWNLHNGWKPVILCGKPPLVAWWEPFSDIVSGGKEKDSHEWQQAESEAAHYINALCPAGGLVADPMCGSGTALVAAQKLGRRIWGCDVDPDAVTQTRSRLR